MKRRISRKRRIGQGKKKTERRSPFEPRPFPASSSKPSQPINQAQQERIARSSPSMLDIPLYPPTAEPTAANTVQMKPQEENLQPPQGTIQRQQAEGQQREEELRLAPQASMPSTEEKEDELQLKQEQETLDSIDQKETEEEDALQAKAEAEAEVEEADKKVQKKEEEEEKLQAKLEPEEDKETM